MQENLRRYRKIPTSEKSIHTIVQKNFFSGGLQQMKAKVHITLKRGVLDPQGKAVQRTLAQLGFKGIKDVRQGKYIELELSESDPEKAKIEVQGMCEKLLANLVIEDFQFEILKN